MPLSHITPGRVEADGGQLLVSLYAVDGELAGGCGSVHGGGIIDDAEHQARHDGAGQQGEGSAADEKGFHGPSPPI